MLKAIALGLALVAVAFGSAQAQTTGSDCAAIEGNNERLACYDGIFRDTGDHTRPEPIVLQSERLIPARPSGRAPATLDISCGEGGPMVSFAFAGQLVSATGDIAPLTLQIDQNATLVRTLSAAGGNTSLTFGTPREVAAFLDSLSGGSNLRVRLTPVGQRSLTVDFRIAESIAGIAALRDACR